MQGGVRLHENLRLLHDLGMKWRTETRAERVRYALGESTWLIPILIGFLAVAALIVWLGIWQARQERLPASSEIGEIVDFGAIQGRTVNRMLVTVRTSEGGIATLSPPPELLFYCHVGSRIRLSRQGQLLRVRSPGCALPI